MAISPQPFPPRKRRPPPSSFIAPDFTDRKLLQSIVLLSQEISFLKPLQFLLKPTFSSIILKSKLIAVIFEEIFRLPVTLLPQSALLCSKELYVVLQRTKALIEDCSNGSKMWLLMQHKLVAHSFHQLTAEISTLLDVFPFKEFSLDDDVKELVVLLKKQCCEGIPSMDPSAENLNQEVLKMLDDLEEAIVPEKSKLENIFQTLELSDSSSCRDEIERLEEEVQSLDSADSNLKVQMLSLMGLVRYTKCVLYGASSPKISTRSARSYSSRSLSMKTDVSYPSDFLCPISLELMVDPVVVATGQTYDRSSISLWIDSGRNTCPKTGQVLVHTNLIPNRSLKNLIVLWCRESKLPFETAENKDKTNGIRLSKAAVEATRMTASFLVNALRLSPSTETARKIVHELRTLAKTVPESRSCIAESGAIPLLVDYFGSDNPEVQLNAVTTILNMSILEANKTIIMETNGVLDGIVKVLRSDATWETKGNAAATLYSLSSVDEYRKELGRKRRVVHELVELARAGPTNPRRDSLAAILNLAGEKACIGKLIEGGVLTMAVEIMEESPEEVATILAVMAKRGGAMAIATTEGAIGKLATVLVDGPEAAKECAAAALDTVSRRGGDDVVALLSAQPRIQKALWDLMRVGTSRARRKAASVWRTLRRWEAEPGQTYQNRVVHVFPSLTQLIIS